MSAILCTVLPPLSPAAIPLCPPGGPAPHFRNHSSKITAKTPVRAYIKKGQSPVGVQE